ncbi:MAG TPA: hypothetical protein VHO68_06365 [Bacteroidales bacterium]|nr:hypothetical protein [Bacteroidales bacterium]
MATRSLLILVLLLTFGEEENISGIFRPELKTSAIFPAAPANEKALFAFSASEVNVDKTCDDGQTVTVGVSGSIDHNSRNISFYNVQLAVYSRKSLACSYDNKLPCSETYLKIPMVRILRL